MLSLAITVFSAVPIHRRVALSSGKKRQSLLQVLKSKQRREMKSRPIQKRNRGRRGGGGVLYLLLSLLRAVQIIACENIRFSSLFAAGGVSRETSPAAKSEEKRTFSQAIQNT